MTDPLDPFEQAPADLASGARARTAELRRSPRVRRALAAGGGAALGAGAVWLLVLAPSGPEDTREVSTVDETTTTTAEASATTTSAPTTSESVVPVSDDTAPSTTEVVTTTVEEPPPEPRCEIATGEPRSFAGWAEYYQTDPGDDQPVSMRLCVDDVTPRVGQVVTVTVAANDPDAVIVDEECGWVISWDSNPLGSLCRDYVYAPPDDPLPTPPREAGHIDRAATSTYLVAGAATITGSVISSVYEGRPHPYGSYVSIDIEVVVHG